MIFLIFMLVNLSLLHAMEDESMSLLKQNSSFQHSGSSLVHTNGDTFLNHVDAIIKKGSFKDFKNLVALNSSLATQYREAINDKIDVERDLNEQLWKKNRKIATWYGIFAIGGFLATLAETFSMMYGYDYRFGGYSDEGIKGQHMSQECIDQYYASKSVNAADLFVNLSSIPLKGAALTLSAGYGFDAFGKICFAKKELDANLERMKLLLDSQYTAN